MRRVIADRLQRSKQQAPHYYMSVDCRAEALEAWRLSINQARGSEQPRVSLNDCLVKAVAMTLSRQPDLNAAYVDGHLHRYQRVDLALAVAIDGGLITPVIRDAASLGVGQIATQSRRLIEAAHARTLQPRDYEGGGFTISNLGMYGIRDFSAIINPPQIAILAIAAVRDQAVAGERPGAPASTGRVLSLGLSVDHRAADGVTGALFLDQLKRFVEDPRRMLL